MMSRSIGKSIYRKEAMAKVTGAAKYTADWATSEMLHIKLVTSPYAHALIKDIDLTEAYQVPGVRRIVIGQPFPLTGENYKIALRSPIIKYATTGSLSRRLLQMILCKQKKQRNRLRLPMNPFPL